MKWSEFKEVVDKWLEENSPDQNPEILYIDTGYGAGKGQIMMHLTKAGNLTIEY